MKLDYSLIFKIIEKTINHFDSTAWACKLRAYPCFNYLHEHVLIKINIMQKPYRDNMLCKQLLVKLNQQLSNLLTGDYFYSLLLESNSEFYISNNELEFTDKC